MFPLASYTDDIGVMLDGTAQFKMFTLDGGGGTSVFGQGKPYFWGTRAITPNDRARLSDGLDPLCRAPLIQRVNLS